jgi:Cu-processing system ATP-binding protein
MLRVQNISKTFGQLKVLDGVSAQGQAGQAVAIVGPNGSGKTTLIKCILGLVRPDGGQVFYHDTIVNADPGYRRHFGYMPQIGRYPDNMLVGQIFDMMRDLRQDAAGRLDEELLEAYRLADIFHKPMRTLSGGTRQKVSAALAFLFQPQVLILDEPTAGLDPLSAEILKEKVLREKQNNRLFLITSHIMSDLDELATHILYLVEGRVVFFKPLPVLKAETGQERLGRAIAHLMQKGTLI